MPVRTGYTCAVHTHDSLIPEHDHHIWPLGRGGPDRAHNIVRVCANGHYLIHDYMDLLEEFDGVVPTVLKRQFNLKVRALALRGYLLIRAHEAAAAL